MKKAQKGVPRLTANAKVPPLPKGKSASISPAAKKSINREADSKISTLKSFGEKFKAAGYKSGGKVAKYGKAKKKK